MSPSPLPGPAEPEIWHDVECAGYGGDLQLWRELALEARGPTLELGCGAGRVLLHLARQGVEVQGIDFDQGLVEVANERAREAGLAASAVCADARDFALGTDFGLVIAPVQFVQLLDTDAERVMVLERVAAHMAPGARAALAMVELSKSDSSDGAPPPLPDVIELDGWVYSSLPLIMRVGDGYAVIERLRQTVDPDGHLTDQLNELRLATIDPEELAAIAGRAGLLLVDRRIIPPTPDHVGSTVLILEAA